MDRRIGTVLPAIGACICLIGLISCDASKENSQIAKPRSVRTMIVTASANSTLATYSGIVRSQRESRLSFRSGGQIVVRKVEVGAPVRQNDIIMSLDPSDAALSSGAAAAQTASARKQAEVQKIEVDRARKLLAAGFVSQAEFDRQFSAGASADAQLDTADAQFKTATHQVAYHNLRAPEAGIIGSISAEAGEVVAAGQVVATLVDPSNCDVLINIPEHQVEAVRSSAHIKITILSDPTHEYRGQIRTLSRVADITTRTFETRVAIADGVAMERIGQTAEVAVSLVSANSTYRIPLTAIVQRGGPPGVFIVDRKKMTIQLRAVIVNGADKTDALISGGLGEGDEIVTVGVHTLQNSQAISLPDSRSGISQ